MYVSVLADSFSTVNHLSDWVGGLLALALLAVLLGLDLLSFGSRRPQVILLAVMLALASLAVVVARFAVASG